MQYVKLTKTFTVTSHGHVDVDLDEHTDVVMNELVALESEHIFDADLTASLAENIVEMSIVAGAEDFDAALGLADSTIRAAIHAAGGSTPEWASAFAVTSAAAELVS